MCGIYCSIPYNCRNSSETIKPILLRLLKRRGPDASRVTALDGLNFGGFVLSQQGNTITSQPYETDRVVLLFNGDMFGLAQEQLEQHNMSDTAWLASELSSKCGDDAAICMVFQHIRGPYSMIFYDKIQKVLFFARDSLGRNSLILERGEEELRLLSSTYANDMPSNDAMELPPLGLYKLSVAQPQQVLIYPWTSDPAINDYAYQLSAMQTHIGLTFQFSTVMHPSWFLIEGTRTPFDFYDLCASYTEQAVSCLMYHLSENKALQAALVTFSTLLEDSVKDRVEKTTKYCTACKGKQTECQHSKIAVLFSGGIDCTILALLADRHVHQADSIDLINVAFRPINGGMTNWEVPDRLTARESLIELQRLCPQRHWNLMEVNVERDELHMQLKQHIKHLIYPLDTVLDESIGAAFWFASRGRVDEFNETTARVCIVGSGADELFGGYIRHRNAYYRCTGSMQEKYHCVSRELEKDWRRIPSRNLARDDRVVADNSKTLRAPFIEEHVVQFVHSLTSSQRCCFLLPEGLGDKLFLRLYGYQLGLRSSVMLKKRAIQFGSKIADKKQKATERSSYLITGDSGRRN